MSQNQRSYDLDNKVQTIGKNCLTFTTPSSIYYKIVA